jgi:hypothetical protein
MAIEFTRFNLFYLPSNSWADKSFASFSQEPLAELAGTTGSRVDVS